MENISEVDCKSIHSSSSKEEENCKRQLYINAYSSIGEKKELGPDVLTNPKYNAVLKPFVSINKYVHVNQKRF